MPRKQKSEFTLRGSPFLTHIGWISEWARPGEFPFSLATVADGINLDITTPVTFFVGENGSGKSTLLEGIAWKAGFASQGGDRNNHYSEDDDGGVLGRALKLSWRQKVAGGFFLRAETFFNFTSYLESVDSTYLRYGGTPLHRRSHGESFLDVFQNRFEDGLYLLDEPEAALSPQRQLAFLAILHNLTSAGVAQFIIATHSPILLAFPGATILNFDNGKPEQIDYRDTEHYRITRDFLEAPERFLRHLTRRPEDE